MNVFITGGTGYLGSVLVEHLIAAGHEVTALARSEESARALTVAGATPLRGSLADTDILKQASRLADAVVHAAVDYSPSEEAVATELAAVAALTEGAGESGKNTTVVYTSTGLVYGFEPDQDSTEDAALPAVSAQPVKVAAERLVLDAPGITGMVFRAGLIFGRGGTGLVTGLIGSAATNGVATYIGDGENSWLPVHVDDLAALYITAIGRPTPGIFNAVGNVRFTFRELAEAIGELTGTPTASVPAATAEAAFGPAARMLTTTSRLDSAKARATFGWEPSDRSLTDDVRAGSYAAG
jgi:nucleoside-diphosphate-sugar epimerase